MTRASFLDRLQPEYLLTPTVIVGSFLWGAFINLSDTSSNGVGSIPERLLSLVVAHVVLFALPLLVWLLMRRSPRRRRVTAALIVAVVVGAVLRGAAIAWMFYLLGASPVLEVPFRVLASVAQMSLSIGLLWLGVTALQRHSARRRELLLEQERLLRLQTEAVEQLQRLDEAAAEQVRASVLAGLDEGDPADADEVLRRMRLTLDDVVRPLSRQLELQGGSWEAPLHVPGDYRLRWWPTLKAAFDPVRLHPAVMVVLVVAVSIISITGRYGLAVGGATAVTALVVMWPVLWLARRLGVAVTRSAPAPLRALAFIAALLVGGNALGNVNVFYALWTSTTRPFATLAVVMVVLIGTLVAIADAALAQSRLVEEELETTEGELRWAIARAREEHRQRRLALAHAVHGRIQATLAAAILQLDRAVQQDAVTDELVSQVQRRVIECVEELDLRTTEPEAVPDLLRKVQATWEGATEIGLDCGPGVEAALALDTQCLVTLNDLVPELVFNSVRHGRASRIDVHLRENGPRTLEFAVIDNGAGIVDGGRQGLGSRLLDDCAIEWSRSSDADGTSTRVVLPLLAG